MGGGMSKQQWLASIMLLLLVLAGIAGVMAPGHDVYHGAAEVSGTVENSEVVHDSGAFGGTSARLHVRLDDGSATIACTSWGGPLDKGVRVVLSKGPCATNPAGNLVIRFEPTIR